jgi:hypothetical protein
MMYYKQMHASYVTVPAYRWNQRELDDDEKSYSEMREVISCTATSRLYCCTCPCD